MRIELFHRDRVYHKAVLNNSTFDVKRNAIIEMDKKGQYAVWVEENIGKLGEIAQQSEEVLTEMGRQCSYPYKCWYYGYCEACSSQMKIEDVLE